MTKRWTAIILLVVLLAVAACNLPKPPPTEISPEDAANTADASTLVALSTDLAAGKNPTLAARATAQGTPSPTSSGGSSNTEQTPAAASATSASGASDGATPDPNTPCNRGEFVRDVTIPDGSTVPPASRFVKIWEIKNTGSCTWTPQYSVAFSGSGHALGGPDVAPLMESGEVKPGQIAQVSVSLQAPGEDGSYKASWLLRAPDGKNFGLGPGATGGFFVDFRVASEYFFAEQLCSAQWSTAAGALPCPGSESDKQGLVVQIKDPKLENGTDETGLALLTVPQPVAGGYIVGRYPAVMVPQEADFRATIGCQNGATGCYVKFKVTYQVDNGPEQPLKEWNEGFDNNVNNAIADLDELAGKSVAFNLYVYVNGTAEASKALWFNPRMVKQ